MMDRYIFRAEPIVSEGKTIGWTIIAENLFEGDEFAAPKSKPEVDKIVAQGNALETKEAQVDFIEQQRQAVKASTVTVFQDPLTRNVREGEATVVVSYDDGSDLIKCDVYFGKLSDGEPLVARMIDREQLVEAGLLDEIDQDHERLVDQVDAMIDEAKYGDL